MRTRLARTWQLLRHHRPSQFAWRLYRRTRTRLPMPGVLDVSVADYLTGFRELNRIKSEARSPLSPREEHLRGNKLPDSTPPVVEETSDGDPKGVAAMAAALGESGLLPGRVTLTFLNQPRTFPNGIDWAVPDAPHLWRFHLHYHEFLWGHPPEERLPVMEDWRQKCPPRRGDAWHPFTISRRLPVWLATLASVDEPPADLVQSAAHQAAWLRADLERDLGGNHLLENAKALALAAMFFNQSRWERTARRLLVRELPLQVLPGGEHFERSPMYCALMAEAMLDLMTCGWWETYNGKDTSFTIQSGLMAVWLLRVIHPDRRIPLFADSAFDQTPEVDGLIRRLCGVESPIRPNDANRPPGIAAVGDYWTYRTTSRTFLIFDAGPLAADELPAHAHCDLLGIELSVEGHRWITDSGVFDYEDSPMRAYCRSTVAHSVPQVEGEEHADMWGKFRVGKRGRIVSKDLPDGPAAAATARMPSGATLTRRIEVDGESILITDDGDRLGGRALISRLHLHPDIEIEAVDAQTIALRREDVSRQLSCSVPIAIKTSWYCPEFNVRHERPVLAARSENEPIRWRLKP